ncbi:MAG: gluconokinase [Daejeonella sp.]
MKYVLGIDIGTGSTKAIALSLDLEPISVSQFHYPTCSALPGYSEQNPGLIFEACLKSLQETLDQLGDSPLAICFSSAMHSLVPVDLQGNKLHDMMTWADLRSDAIASRLINSAEGAGIYETTSMPLHAMSPLCKIIWIRENMPGLFYETHKFLSIKEYIWFKIFGEYRIDHSLASATGMFDIFRLKWSAPILEVSGINVDHLSHPVSTSYSGEGIGSLGKLVKGLSANTPVIIGASDGCLANLGSFALEMGIAALTIGTSGAVRIASNKPLIDQASMTFSYCLDENTFICGGPVNNGGNVLQWLVRDFLGETPDGQSFKELFNRVETIKAGSEGLLFLPYLNGERAPIWDAKSCGTFFGIKTKHTRSHFSRAVIEGISYALNDVLLAVTKNSTEIKQINVSGGFVNSKTWMQILADITGKRLSLIHTEDASAIGAGFMAMKYLGLNEGNYPAAPGNKLGRVIEPDMNNHAIYRRNFVIFKQLYSNLKDTMHQLNLIGY